MRIAFLLISIVLTSVLAYAQDEIYDPHIYLEWNEFNPLEWEDFKAAKDEAIFGDAGTVVKIIAKPYLVRRDVHYNVYALFDTEKSWAGDVSNRLLIHERLHFDIAELYARKIRKVIAMLQSQRVREVAIYNKAIKKLLKESNVMDARYDRETLHGALTAKQIHWQSNVRAQLKALSKYAYQASVITKR